MKVSGVVRRLGLSVAVVAAVSLVLLGCSASGTSSAGSPSDGAVAPGKAADTITWAEPPATTPNWIWPFLAPGDGIVINTEMQSLMYRPLYWFGNDGKTGPDYDLSLADPPVFSDGGTTVTITLKDYTWSDGEKLTPQDVLFWINLVRAEKKNYGAYVPGQFPDDIVSATASGPDKVVLTTDKAYSRQWFLYNQLSQITPMPMAWDMTGATTKGDCAADVSACAPVFRYLTAQAKDLPGYATSKIWSVVDGPWKLSSFNSDGRVSFVPNPHYSGPVKPHVKQFDMVPFTTDTAEFNVLRGGSTLDVGYIPTQDIARAKPAGSAPDAAGPNPLSADYRMMPWFLYGFNFFAINFQNPTVGPIFRQLYFRQALQSTVDQPGVITAAAKNYGVPTTGPVPTFPDSPLVSSVEKDNPYPFSVSRAKRYLSDNGWKVVPGGTSTCARPGTAAGDCGAGIAKGAQLVFTLPYASGTATTETAMASLKSTAAQAGIVLNLKPEPFNTVTASMVSCQSGQPCWQMANWGGGWTYGPNYYPTGEQLFAAGVQNSFGGYSDPTMDRLVAATDDQSGIAVMHAYEDFAAKDLPVIYQPSYTTSLVEVARGLKGYTSNNPYGLITPEDWRL